MAIECGICKKSGSWFTYNEEKLGQGREQAKATLKSNSKLKNELEQKVRKELGFKNEAHTKKEKKPSADILEKSKK